MATFGRPAVLLAFLFLVSLATSSSPSSSLSSLSPSCHSPSTPPHTCQGPCQVHPQRLGTCAFDLSTLSVPPPQPHSLAPSVHPRYAKDGPHPSPASGELEQRPPPSPSPSARLAAGAPGALRKLDAVLGVGHYPPAKGAAPLHLSGGLPSRRGGVQQRHTGSFRVPALGARRRAAPRA